MNFRFVLVSLSSSCWSIYKKIHFFGKSKTKKTLVICRCWVPKPSLSEIEITVNHEIISFRFDFHYNYYFVRWQNLVHLSNVKFKGGVTFCFVKTTKKCTYMHKYLFHYLFIPNFYFFVAIKQIVLLVLIVDITIVISLILNFFINNITHSRPFNLQSLF